MGNWAFNDGPFCEDFDAAKDAKNLPCSSALWRERADQTKPKNSRGESGDATGRRLMDF